MFRETLIAEAYVRVKASARCSMSKALNLILAYDSTSGTKMPRYITQNYVNDFYASFDVSKFSCSATIMHSRIYRKRYNR